MRIAIHHRKGSFSDRWIDYCEKQGIDYKVVDAYASDIIEQVKDCKALLWNHHQSNFKDKLTARRILFSLEHAGKKVFPDFNTGWYFDDKVAQKYLLEAIGAPLVPSYVFYDKQDAKKWAQKTAFPKVFKLAGGAGSANVLLVENERKAVRLINKAFGKGFSQYNAWGAFKERFRKYKLGKSNKIELLKSIIRLMVPTKFAREQARERGYVYFQEFIPKNEFDIRVIIIGKKAFAIKRLVRENDFRASGSGLAIFDKSEIPISCVKTAFEINAIIKSQSIGFDFVFDEKGFPLIVEMGYAFTVSSYDPCPGYWDSGLKWHDGKFNPQKWMIEDILND